MTMMRMKMINRYAPNHTHTHSERESSLEGKGKRERKVISKGGKRQERKALIGGRETTIHRHDRVHFTKPKTNEQ